MSIKYTTKEDVLREHLLKDFIAYLRWSFKTKYKTKVILKEFHIKICKELIRCYLGEIQNLCITVPPRSGKTTIVSIFLEWTITKHQEAKNIMTSYSDTLVSNTSQSIRDMLNSNEHKQLFNIETKKDSQSKKLWKTSLDGGIYAVSSFGQLTGFGAGLKIDTWGGCIVIDDPLKPNDKDSLLMLDKIKEWYQTTLSNRKNNPKTPIIVIMQRLHTNDLVGCIKNNDFDDLHEWTFLEVAMLDEDNNTSLWEEFYPVEKLLQIKKSNPSYFYSQFQQTPIVKGGNLLKTNWIKYISKEITNKIHFERRFITVDSALKDKEKNDYTVYSSFGVYENKLYFLDMFRGKPLSKEREITAKAFYNLNNLYPFQGMYIEQKASGIDLFQRMKDDAFMVFEVERNSDKYFRCENVAPYLETYGLYVVEDLPNINDFLDEYTQFPNSKHDDILDTVIDAVELAYKNQIIDYSTLL